MTKRKSTTVVDSPAPAPAVVLSDNVSALEESIIRRLLGALAAPAPADPVPVNVTAIERHVAESREHSAPIGNGELKLDSSSVDVDVMIKGRDGQSKREKRKLYLRRPNREKLCVDAIEQCPSLRFALLDSTGQPTQTILELPFRQSAWSTPDGQRNPQYGDQGIELVVPIADCHYRLKTTGIYFNVTEKFSR